MTLRILSLLLDIACFGFVYASRWRIEHPKEGPPRQAPGIWTFMMAVWVGFGLYDSWMLVHEIGVSIST